MRSEVELRELQGPGWFMFFSDAVRIESTSIPGPAIGKEAGPRGELKTWIDYKTDYEHVGWLQVLLSNTTWIERYDAPVNVYDRKGYMVEALYGHAIIEPAINYAAKGEALLSLDVSNIADSGAVIDKFGSAHLRLKTDISLTRDSVLPIGAEPALQLRSESTFEFRESRIPVIELPINASYGTRYSFVLRSATDFEVESIQPESLDVGLDLRFSLDANSSIDIFSEALTVASHYTNPSFSVIADIIVDAVLVEKTITNEDDAILALFLQAMMDIER